MVKAAQVPPGGPYDEGAVDEAQRLLREAVTVARDLLVSLRRFARLEREQFWLGPDHDQPELTWMTDLRDDAGTRLATGYNDPIVMHGHSGQQPALGLIDMHERAERGLTVESSLAAELLADAHFYALSSDPPDSRMGVILAAIAAEVRVKTFLSERATSEQASLLDLILNNPRDVSVAAVSLYDKALKAVIGRSLREDRREVFKDLSSLFERRNRLAHRGHAGSDDIPTATVATDLRAA